MRRRYFFPKPARRQRRFIAMLERQWEGKLWKWPHQSWAQARRAIKARVRTLIGEAGSSFIKDRLREVSFVRKILPPQVIRRTDPVVQPAIDAHREMPFHELHQRRSSGLNRQARAVLNPQRVRGAR